MSDEAPVFETRIRARSYELDSFGHVNHAVFLNWLEQARFDCLEAGGTPADALAEEGWAVVVARIEVDYLEEVRLGEEVVVRTRVREVRKSSMTLEQRIVRAEPGADGTEEQGDDAVAEARVVAVWLREGRPRRMPAEVRAAFGVG